MQRAVHGVDVHLLDRGAGLPTLLLHGNPDTADLWAGVIDQLAGRYHCLAPDLPGYGRSIAPPDFDLALDNMARFIDGLVEAVGIGEPLNLVAHDFGGHYGLAWAITHPEKVRRLAIMNTAFFSDYRWHSVGQLLRTPLVGEVVTALMTPSAIARAMRIGSPGITAAGLRYAATLRLSPATKRMMLRLYRVSDPMRFVGWEDRLLAVTARVPTWVLWGDRDPYVSATYADRFGARRVCHFAEGGHWLPLEVPEQVAERLTELFASSSS